MPIAACRVRREPRPSVRLARRKLRRNELDHKPRSKDDQDPGESRHADGRRLPGFEPRDRRLTEPATTRERVLTPWNSQSCNANGSTDLGQGIEFRGAVSLYLVGHGPMKPDVPHPRLIAPSSATSSRLYGSSGQSRAAMGIASNSCVSSTRGPALYAAMGIALTSVCLVDAGASASCGHGHRSEHPCASSTRAQALHAAMGIAIRSVCLVDAGAKRFMRLWASQ
jgi:hypothetical protein